MKVTSVSIHHVSEEPGVAYVNKPTVFEGIAYLDEVPTPSDIHFYTLDVALEVDGVITYSSRQDLSAWTDVQSFKVFYTFGREGTYRVRVGARVVPTEYWIFIPYGQVEYVWSAPIYVEVRAVTPPTAPPEVVPPEEVRREGLKRTAVAIGLGLAIIALGSIVFKEVA